MTSVSSVLIIFCVVAMMVVDAANYTVIVGYERIAYGMEYNVFFPQNLTVHQGDKVTFVQNSMLPHTVTFNPVGAFPPLQNPDGSFNSKLFFPAGPVPPATYSGATYANSGIMANSTKPDKWSLIFSTKGTFKYDCAIHYGRMIGWIKVVNASVEIPTPKMIEDQVKKDMSNKKVLIPGLKLYRRLRRSVPKPKKNADGSHTHYVKVGASVEQFEFLGHYEFLTYFPKRLVVHTGDWVEFANSTFHTVTFHNGTPELPLFVFGPGNPPKVSFNPAVVLPKNTGKPLTESVGLINSGLIVDPTIKFLQKIGNETGTFEFECEIHEESGMSGIIVVRKGKKK